MKNRVTFTFWISKELKEKLQKEAKEKGLTLSAYITTILNGREK